MTSALGFLNKILTAKNCDSGAESDRDDDIENTAKDLAFFIVNHYTKGLAARVDRRIPACSRTLLRVVEYMSERHNILFSGIVRRLEASRENVGHVFQNVVNEMFADGQYNWGRVVTVYAFAGWLARYCCCAAASDGHPASVSKDDPDCAIKIAECAGDYVAERLSAWVRKQGGWDVMKEFFSERDDPEGALWHGLLYTFVGLGALAAMAAVR